MNQKTIAEQHQMWCVHYQRSPGNPADDVCRAGVVYQELAKVEELGRVGWALRLPCVRWPEDKRKGHPVSQCPHHRWPTLQESQDYAAELDAEMAEMLGKI